MSEILLFFLSLFVQWTILALVGIGILFWKQIQNVNEQQTAFEKWRNLPVVEYEPGVRYYLDDGFITYFASDKRCVANQIDSTVTIYKCVETNEIIGFKVRAL